jgi:hypothetical protein
MEENVLGGYLQYHSRDCLMRNRKNMLFYNQNMKMTLKRVKNMLWQHQLEFIVYILNHVTLSLRMLTSCCAWLWVPAAWRAHVVVHLTLNNRCLLSLCLSVHLWASAVWLRICCIAWLWLPSTWLRISRSARFRAAACLLIILRVIWLLIL